MVVKTRVQLIGNSYTDEKFIVVNGKCYVQKNTSGYNKSHTDNGKYKIDFVKVNKNVYLKRIDELSKKLSGKLNPQIMLKQALKEMPEESISNIEKEMKKKKPKIKTKEHCFFLGVGKEKIYLRE